VRIRATHGGWWRGCGAVLLGPGPRRHRWHDQAGDSGSLCDAAWPCGHRYPARRRGGGAVQAKERHRTPLFLPPGIVQNDGVLDHLDACDEVRGRLGLDEVTDVSIFRWQRPPMAGARTEPDGPAWISPPKHIHFGGAVDSRHVCGSLRPGPIWHYPHINQDSHTVSHDTLRVKRCRNYLHACRTRQGVAPTLAITALWCRYGDRPSLFVHRAAISAGYHLRPQ
jgi:hypothetical protein